MYVIKHNALLKNCYVTFGSLLWKIIGIFVKTDDNLILFVGNVGKSFSGSPYEIYKYMQENEKYNKYYCVWAFSDPSAFKKYKLNMVKFDTFDYFLTALRARYWVTDVNIERSLKFKKKTTRYLNTWHGVALKKIGNDDKNSGRYDYSNIDFLCVSGEHDKRVYTSALNASRNSFLECGMPRNDILFRVTTEDYREIRQKLNVPEGKKVILYAPTWRDSVNNGISYDFVIPVDFKRWKKILGSRYILFFRAHDRTTKVMNVQFNDFVRDMSHYDQLNDLLIAADLLITDYSSIIFDYSILGKPTICFGPDFEEYCRERGVYFDPEKIYPGGVLRTEEQLLNEILTLDYEKRSKDALKLKMQFMEYSQGNAAQKCIEAILG